MPTIPLPEADEPDPRAEQAREIVRRATRSVGATERRSFTTIAALIILGITGVSSPSPIESGVALTCAVIVALTMDRKP